MRNVVEYDPPFTSPDPHNRPGYARLVLRFDGKPSVTVAPWRQMSEAEARALASAHGAAFEIANPCEASAQRQEETAKRLRRHRS